MLLQRLRSFGWPIHRKFHDRHSPSVQSSIVFVRASWGRREALRIPKDLSNDLLFCILKMIINYIFYNLNDILISSLQFVFERERLTMKRKKCYMWIFVVVVVSEEKYFAS